jgi:uncharacterized protein (DUF1330 family)
MKGSREQEQPNPEGFAAFAARAGEGHPVVMLNLLAFVPDGGRKRYEEYGEAVAPLLAKVGGQIVLAGEGSPPVLGNERWDLVALVEYPSRQAFLDMVGSEEYRAVEHLRSEALARSELHPLDAVS